MSCTGAHSCLLIIQVWAAETLSLAETSLPQIVFVCFILVYLFISVFCICVYLLVLLFRFGRVVRHWAGCAETSTALHSALPPSTVGVFSALGAGTGSFTLLNNRVRKKSIPFSPFQFYIPKSPETTFMYLSFEPWPKEGLPYAEILHSNNDAYA